MTPDAEQTYRGWTVRVEPDFGDGGWRGRAVITCSSPTAQPGTVTVEYPQIHFADWPTAARFAWEAAKKYIDEKFEADQ
jgi:hypothetical protein